MKRIARAIKHEVRVAIPAFLFFLVFFHMLAATRAVISGNMEFTTLKASAATIGALLVAKSILVVEALPPARWFGGILVANILWRAFLFGLVVIGFRVLEQALEDYVKLGNVRDLSSFFSQALTPQVLVETGWIFIGMFGFCLIAEYCRLLGGKLVWKVMTHPRIERRESEE